MLNATNLGTNSTIVNQSVSYLSQAPSNIMQGDMLALIVLFIGGFITIFIINKLSGLLLSFVKRIIVLIITLAGIFHFSQKYFALVADGFTPKLIAAGILGAIVAVAGLMTGIHALVHHTKHHVKQSFAKKEEEQEQKEIVESVEAVQKGKSLTFKDLTNVSKLFSKQSIKNEKSLLSAVTYLLIGQFGVFSSKTVAAPTIKTGVIMMVCFFLGSFLFLRQSYDDYKQGLEHFGVVFTLSVVLSIVLGYAWGGYDSSTLFSMQFFVTDCLVAVITGTAVALFAGSK